MKNILMIPILILFTFNTYSQDDLTNEMNNTEIKRILRSYITAGYGITINDRNWAFGVGWFLFYQIPEDGIVSLKIYDIL
jgi:hypothetical protein